MVKKKLTPKEWSLIKKYKSVIEDVDINLLEKHPESFGNDNKGKESLKICIEESGQARPIICRKLPNGNLQIIDGSRIWLAIKELKWQQITVLIIEIEEDEVYPLMCTLHSHNKRFKYRQLAEKYVKLKEHAQSLVKVGGAKDEDGNCITTRKYLQGALGFTNEHAVTDFERILKAKRSNDILDLLDGGQIKFARALRMATNDNPPKRNKKIDTCGGGRTYCCSDCPEKKKFIDKANDESDLYKNINDLPQTND